MPYTIEQLADGKGFAEMTKEGQSRTCYDLAVRSLVVTGNLKEAVFLAWTMAVPKANTFEVVNPALDTRIIDPAALPANSLIGFYRRFRMGEQSALMEERTSGWIIYHMVRTTSTANSNIVLGGNNGDRKGTTPSWSLNKITDMFDWSGGEETSMAQGGLPGLNTYGVGRKQQFVAFAASVATVVQRLNKAYPGPAAFG